VRIFLPVANADIQDLRAFQIPYSPNCPISPFRNDNNGRVTNRDCRGDAADLPEFARPDQWAIL